MKEIIEQDTRIFVPSNLDKISKKLPVFYNPAMELNRTLSVLVLNALKNKSMQIALPLAGSGVRGTRFLNELKKGKIKSMDLNDLSREAVKLCRKNISLAEKHGREIRFHNKEANQFLLESSGFDYIDLDPFGSPNPFLNSAITRIARNGMLAVTATDTSALCGTYKNACLRKYWAKPLRNYLMHEIGLRILIRKIQLIGAQFEKALIPVLGYSKDHYMRVFLKCEKGKKKCDSIIKEHKYFLFCKKCHSQKVSETNCGTCCGERMEYAGPVWAGRIYSEGLLAKIKKEAPEKYDRFVSCLYSEALFEKKHNQVGFIKLDKVFAGGKIPKKERIISLLEERGFDVTETHFSENSIRTTISPKEIKKLANK